MFRIFSLPFGIRTTLFNSFPTEVRDTYDPLKAKLACQPARCLLPVEIIERCGLATGPATAELLPYLLLY